VKIISSIALLLSFANDLCALTSSPVKPYPVVNQQANCADFLEQLRRVPKGLEFVDCRRVNEHGSVALQANYRVSGAKASDVETYLVNTSGMPPLRFICCGWESAPRHPRTQRGYGVYRLPKSMRPSADVTQLHISMNSGETLVNQRSDWPRLEYFQVRALLYIELP
jgi:hypothetical protein